MYIPFDETTDKITEQEMVGDILDRLKLTYPVADSSRTYFDSGTGIPEMIIKQISLLSHKELINNYKNLRCADLVIDAGTRGGTVAIEGPEPLTLLYALSTQSGWDVKDFVHVFNRDGTTIFTVNSTIPFNNPDTIKIYAC